MKMLIIMMISTLATALNSCAEKENSTATMEQDLFRECPEYKSNYLALLFQASIPTEESEIENVYCYTTSWTSDVVAILKMSDNWKYEMGPEDPEQYINIFFDEYYLPVAKEYGLPQSGNYHYSLIPSKDINTDMTAVEFENGERFIFARDY